MLIKDSLKDKCIKVKQLSKKLNIEYRKVSRWANYESCENHIEFLKLVVFLGIDPADLIADYYKKKERL